MADENPCILDPTSAVLTCAAAHGINSPAYITRPTSALRRGGRRSFIKELRRARSL